MEHRMNLRLPVSLVAELVTPKGVLQGTTVDLSFEGAGIALQALPPILAEHAPVQIRLGPACARVGLPAVVIRQTGRLLGLTFGRYDSAADLYLSDRLTEALTRSTR